MHTCQGEIRVRRWEPVLGGFYHISSRREAVLHDDLQVSGTNGEQGKDVKGIKATVYTRSGLYLSTMGWVLCYV